MAYSSIIYIGGSNDITLRGFDTYVKPILEKNGLSIGDTTRAKRTYDIGAVILTVISNKDGSIENLDDILTNSLREVATNALDIMLGKSTSSIVNEKRRDKIQPGDVIDIPVGTSINYAVPKGEAQYEILAKYKNETDAAYSFQHVHRNLFDIKRRARKK